MANYNLVVKYVDNKNQIISWEKLFQIDDYKNNFLPNIDYFTSHFKDRYELIETLEFFNIIEKRNVKKNIAIEYKNKGCIKKALIIYKDDLKFLDVNYMYKYILLNCNNIHFLKFLYDYFKDNPVQKNNITVLGTYINKFEGEFYSKYGFNESIDIENNVKALKDMIKRHIYKYDNETKQYVCDEDGNFEFNYKQYRDFAKLLSNYSKKYNTNEQIEAFEKEYIPKREFSENIKRFTKKR